jgi:Domain of unknown function (DUF2383)
MARRIPARADGVSQGQARRSGRLDRSVPGLVQEALPGPRDPGVLPHATERRQNPENPERYRVRLQAPSGMGSVQTFSGRHINVSPAPSKCLPMTNEQGRRGRVSTCADGLKSSQLKQMFQHAASRCAQAVSELQAEVRALGGDPERRGSVSGSDVAPGSTSSRRSPGWTKPRFWQNASVAKMSRERRMRMLSARTYPPLCAR